LRIHAARTSLLCLAGACATSLALAQPYDASWHTVDGGGGMNAAGGTFALSGTIGQPDAGGPALGGTFGLHSGFWALAASGTVVPQADLSVTKTDGVTTVQPGQPVTYTIAVTNVGPSPVVGATVTDNPPAILAAVTWTCSGSAGSSCPSSGAGAINHAVDVAVGGTLTYSMTGTLVPNASGTLVNTATVTAPGSTPDPNGGNNSATDTDAIVPAASGPEGELVHGTRLRGDLAAVGAADRDLFRLRQQPYASYEVVVDAASGDVGAGQGPALDRVGMDGSTVLQPSQPAGSGPARSLRWMNLTGAVVDAELVRVQSASCTTGCGTDDAYRLRAYETTYTLPRFNNSASQVTVVLLQNPTGQPVQARLAFWDAAGTLLLEHPVTLPPHGSAGINTASLPGLGGQGGSVTVIHDAPYGALAGKGVALEPATGFAFDSPLAPRAR
jgi:uncharacterized repeat protein (TIGR01451 family)